MGNHGSIPRSVSFARSVLSAALLLVVPALAAAADKDHGKGKSLDPAGIERLKASAAGRVRVSTSDATGAVRFAGIEPGERGDLMPAHRGAPADKARQFLRQNTTVFGLTDADSELQLAGEQTDELGSRHVSFLQTFHGVPVFGGVLRAHVDPSGALTSVNGNVIPDVDLDATPSRAATEAGAVAIAAVAGDNPGREVFVRSGLLVVYRTGLAQDTDGQTFLTWQMEVGNGADVREFVYVDAHSGKIVDRLPGIIDAMNRRAYDGQNLNQVPPTYPGSPYWVEGQTFPTASAEANNMITSSKETYDFYKNAFGRDSFDGAGATMDSIFNRGYQCPNASWNGTFISFCPGFTVDDVTAHEWTHAYTQYTHGLIYAWQPGALNEAYSDIFGETIDLINGRGTDSPDAARTADACSVYFGTPPPVLTITGGSAAGSYFSRASVNEPTKPFTITGAMAVPTPASACGPVTGVSGKIAVVDWTLTSSGGNECGSGARATNAYNGGATGIIFVAPASGILNLGSIPQIGSVEVTRADGNKIVAGIAGATATITLGVGTDSSYRWLIGEDVTNAQSPGALRDMANPRCFGNPGKLSDTFEYACSTADQGGVHTNSGIPNHAYQLIVDGGTYNGQTIVALGITKAAHIYFRAMTVYQHPTTTFPDHADAIERSAADLIGINLPDLNTGAPSGQTITAADVDQVKKAMLAVEMRNPPTQCGFQPLLAQNPPALCPANLKVDQLFQDTFETTPQNPWAVSHVAVTPADFTPRDWQIVGNLPDGRTGKAMFALDPTYGTCAPGGDESGVLNLTSPQITIPANTTNPRMTFVHWVASEPGFDGGNLWISVNGGAYKPIAPADFIYNAYNRSLVTAAAGNTNPLAGQPAWSGTDGGAVDGSWGRSIVNLAPYAKSKDKIRLRYEFGNDGCGGVFGWYVDDVTVYRCK
jgi:Zn-dependent metalloprotease